MFTRSLLLALIGLSVVSCRTTTHDAGGATQVLDTESSGVAQVLRFDAWLSILRETIEEADDYKDAAKGLIKGTNRVAAFNLQALGKLYEPDDEFFKKFRKSMKKLEDGIGEFDKWDQILEKAQDQGASNSVLVNLEKKKKKAREELEKLLKDEGYRGNDALLKGYDKTIKSFGWADYDTDKGIVLDRLAGLLEEIAATEWDFAYLEEGNGVHEFRRQIRWFLIEARVLNGLVLLKPLNSPCPSSVYAGLPSQPIAASKYGKLPSSDSEISPVSITPCLFLALATIVEEVGKLKDDSEFDNNNNDGDATDDASAIQAKVEALYTELMDAEVLGALAAELREGIPQ